MQQLVLVYAWLRRNKATWGAVFGSVAAWGAIQGCPPVIGVDVLQHLGLTCVQANAIIGLVGAFFFGGGHLTSDHTEKVVQGILPPVGPPTPPSAPAPVHITQGPGFKAK